MNIININANTRAHVSEETIFITRVGLDGNENVVPLTREELQNLVDAVNQA